MAVRGDLLACPICRTTLRCGEFAAACSDCGRAFPVVDGITYVTEPQHSVDEAIDWLQRTTESTRTAYAQLIEQRRRRRHSEPYAWFRPFNESSRAVEPLLPILHEAATGGGAILDLWNRTGWTGAWLASLFPDNEVVSIWEGDRDQLGYGGFERFLPASDRPANLTLAFADPSEPLPFADDTFAIVHGLDSLHRYPTEHFVEECLRVGADDGVVVFPHIHLTNSEPEPFFERGCRQRHGREWGCDFDDRLSGSPRRAWVLSERQLYEERDGFVLADDRETSHYNGLLLVAAAKWDGRTLARPAAEITETSAVFVNPVLEIDWSTGTTAVRPESRDGTVGHMLVRHAVSMEPLAANPPMLTSDQRQLLAFASAGLHCGEIATAIGMNLDGLCRRLEPLLARDVVVVANVSESTVALQRYFRDVVPSGADFAQLWADLGTRYGDRPVVLSDDGSQFDAADIELLTTALLGWFMDAGLTAGDVVALAGEPHPEYLLTVWAAWRAGLVVAPLSTRSTPSELAAATTALGATAVFGDHEWVDQLDAANGSTAVVVFDPVDPNVELDSRHFATVLAPFIDQPAPAEHRLAADRPAAVLFTSGSTGEPKAVELSMRSLLWSSAGLVSFFDLDHNDVLLSAGGLHTMSGLRNPTLVSLQAGAQVVVPGEACRHALGIVETARRQRATVVSTSPALLMALRERRSRLAAARPLADVRLVLSTGAPMSGELATAIEDDFDVVVGDYYGLTETGGFCAGVPLDATGSDRDMIGRAVGAAIDVRLGDESVGPGAAGEICVSGPGIATRYRVGGDLRRVGGWVLTGDRGVVDEGGNIQVVGRDDGLVKNRQGERVSGEEIAAFISSSPAVAECVVGTVREVGELHAYVVAEPNVDEVALPGALRTLVQAELGLAKTPDRIDLVDRLPVLR